ncbi:MAG: glutathione S-transferase family protein [Pseudomonadota bacterium]
MSEIILHNYPQSPVAEKVRKGLGLKGLAWRDVEIPRLPPKPDLTVLTGGYRRTPVMQIGADIYCDSQCILRELDRRHPEPTFFPGGAQGMAIAVSRWTDGELFDMAVKIILGAAGDALDPDFAADRGRLYLGPDWADRLKAANADLPHLAAQMRAALGWVDQRLSKGRDFMLGTAPGLPDVLNWHVVWFLRGRWADGPAFLEQFTHLTAWEGRMEALGQGKPTAMTAAEAHDAARSAQIATPEATDPGDPQGLTPGQQIAVAPDLDGGEQAVEGVCRLVGPDQVALVREAPGIGPVCVHFPRAGYRVEIKG